MVVSALIGKRIRPPDTALDAAAITAVLAAHAVDYVLIGGVAMQAHGHIRPTNDLDIVAAPDFANLSRLGEALPELEARFARSELGFAALAWLLQRIRSRSFPRLRAFHLGLKLYRAVDLSDPHLLRRAPLIPIATKHGQIDLINVDNLSGGPHNYQDLREGAFAARVGDHQVPVASVDDLVRIVRGAGRESDLRDIAALTRGGTARPGAVVRARGRRRFRAVSRLSTSGPIGFGSPPLPGCRSEPW